jgi:S-adenosyl methyltransferase
MPDTMIHVGDGGSIESTDYATHGDPVPPPQIDVSIAHPARIYDFLLGGKDNYEADREVAQHMLAINPQAAPSARRNREFILRAVRAMVEDLGIDQIVDLGTGIPTAPTVHRVARDINPDVVVAYVDNDPIVMAHDRALLAVEPGVLTVLADLTHPPSVLDDPEIGGLIDWSRPVGIIMAAVFHFVPPQRDPEAMVAAYRDRMAPGSVAAISMLTSEGAVASEMSRARQEYQERATQGLTFRSRAEVGAFFAGFDLVEPGLVHPAEWRPTQLPPTETEGSDYFLVGVGRKPGAAS